MERKGKFVSLEGMEGSGKTSLTQALGIHYKNKGTRIFLTREPGGTALGNDLRNILLPSYKESLDPVAELFLLEAARAQHVSHVVKKALRQNDLVVTDRFTDSTLAYQGGGRGLPLDLLQTVNQFACFGLKPDLVILLDMVPEKALERAMKRISAKAGKREDRFEREELQFHQRVRNAYQKLANQNPDRFFVVDASKPRQEIENQAVKRIDELLSLSKGSVE